MMLRPLALLLALVIALVMMVSLPACSDSTPSSGAAPSDATSSEPTDGGPSNTGPEDAAPAPESPAVEAPVAIHWWGHSMMSIETYWNHRIAIDPPHPRYGYPDPKIEADVVLMTPLNLDHVNSKLVGGIAKPIRAFNAGGRPVRQDLVMLRTPNESLTQIVTAEEAPRLDAPHRVHLESVDSWARKKDDGTLEPNALWVIETDGVRIVHTGDIGQATLRPEQVQLIGSPIDVLCVSVGGIWSIDGPGAVKLIEQLEPRFVVPLHFRTDATTDEIELGGIDPFLEALPEDWKKRTIDGNTFAVSAGPPTEVPEILLMDYRPWAMPTELAELFDEKDAANTASQAVFEPLTVAQMNHRPSDQSHTPRWNAEHLMGTEMRIFSGIFNSVDENVPVINLLPEQMPEDYVAAHSTWDGAEEARQLEPRVTAFVRRFAYLLDDVDLDEQLDGGSMTLRGAFELMAQHYGEHTANVKKKFDLPDWPAE